MVYLHLSLFQEVWYPNNCSGTTESIGYNNSKVLGMKMISSEKSFILSLPSTVIVNTLAPLVTTSWTFEIVFSANFDCVITDNAGVFLFDQSDGTVF